MSNRHRAQQGDRPKLTLVRGGGGEQPTVMELLEMLGAVGAPMEVMQAVEESASPQEALATLEQHYAPPPPLENLIDQWKALLADHVTPLDAEVRAAEFVGTLRSTASDPDDVPEMLLDLIACAAETTRPEALAMMRVLAITGPVEVRSAAAQTAERLAAAGVTDRPWAGQVGAPKVEASFGYSDELGGQETIAMTFSYDRRPHAIMVLIDHGLGGGVKDCWIDDSPTQTRDRYQEAAQEYGLTLHDYRPAEARTILDRALAEDPCPVDPGQTKGVDTFLDLLKVRVESLTS
jgi:hypothetical protein